ncbi:hypothetical protein D3C81_1200520 [compost metagenome]
MLELVADAVLVLIEVVEAVIVQQRVGEVKVLRVVADSAAGAVAQHVGEQGQLGVVAEVPGERRRQVQAVVRHFVAVAVFELGVAVAGDADHPVEIAALVIHAVADIELALHAIMAASLQFHLMHTGGGGFLADAVDQATGFARAEQGGRGTTQDVDAFERVGFGAKEAVAVIELAQAVAKVVARLCVEAADVQPVITLGVHAEGFHLHARHVAQGFGHALHVLRVHLLAGHHRDRLRRLQERRVGLGAGPAAARHVADAVVLDGCGHGGGFHAQGVGRDQPVGAVVAALQLQAMAAERLLHGLLRGVLAVHRVG